MYAPLQVSSVEPSLNAQQQSNLQSTIQNAQSQQAAQPQAAPVTAKPKPSVSLSSFSWLHRKLR